MTIPVGGSRSYDVVCSPVERFDIFGTLTITSNANGGDIDAIHERHSRLASGYGLDPEARTVGSEGGDYTVYVDGREASRRPSPSTGSRWRSNPSTSFST